MRHCKSVDSFLIEVEDEIKWKRAKKAASEELRNHISDNYDALVTEGHSSETAQELAITRMGSPKEIGEMLNNCYRPFWNLGLIFLLLLLLALNFISARFLWAPAGSLTVTIAGAILTGLLMFADYSILFRHSGKFAIIYSSVTGICLILESLVVRQNYSYQYSFYFVILSPIIMIGIIVQQVIDKKRCSLMFVIGWSTLYILIAAIIKSPCAAVVLIIINGSLIVSCSFRHMMAYRRVTLMISGIILAITCMTVFIIFYHYFSITNIFPSEDYYAFVRNLPFIGESSAPDVLNHTAHFSHPILFPVVRYGRIVILALLSIYIWLITLLIRTMKQKSGCWQGKLLTFFAVLFMGIQVILSVLSDIGVIPVIFYMNYPFVASGGCYTVCNCLVLGLVLSVSRHHKVYSHLFDSPSCG